MSGRNLVGEVRRGLIWSTVNSLVLRLSSLVLGIVLARLLSPEAFGVFAIALTVQSVLMTLVDLGMSADLVRSADPQKRAPTVATISLLSGVLLAGTLTLASVPIAAAMGEPDAAPVLAVLSWSLVLSGAGVVPYAHLQRQFEQRKLFACAVVDFAVGTTVTVGLVLLGFGPMALAISRVAAQTAATALQFALAGMRPHFGFDRDVARSAVAFGAPLAGANMLSWALLNIDNVAIAHVAGTTALGLYVLAFNISSWPMSAIGQAVRSVSLAGFSRADDGQGERGLIAALSLTWAVALPVGVLLAALAGPLVNLLYGTRWAPAATVLAALGIFGALRVVFDLLATYLMAKGAARLVLFVQILWFLALLPAVVAGTAWKGIAGAGWAHLCVGAFLILPAYFLALGRTGVPTGPLIKALWPATAAAVPMWWVADAVTTQVEKPIAAIVLGGTAGVLTYGVLCFRWIRSLLPPGDNPDAAEPVLAQPQLGGAT